jgi:hypothetical protein
MAQLGARLIDSTAKQMADQFFDRFAANLSPAPELAATTASPGPGDVGVTETPRSAPEDAANAAAMAATRSPANRAATDARVATAAAGGAASGTDTEYLRDADAPGPLTQHGAEGPSAGGGRPVYRPNPRPQEPEALRPLRLLLQIEPFGLPLQFWIGCIIMLIILALMYL